MAQPHRTEDQANPNDGIDLEQFAHNMAAMGTQYQELLQKLMEKSGEQPMALEDQLHIGAAFMQMFSRICADPANVYRVQMNLMEDYFKLWRYTFDRMVGNNPAPLIEPDSKDRRFRDAAWGNPTFDTIKQFYLLTSKRMEEAVKAVHGLDSHTKRKVGFYTQQFLDALSPSNFLMTNPEALRATLETHGENLVKGMENLIADVTSGRISMTDLEAFKVGENIAASAGEVVYENDLMQLIQYTPATDKVYQTPLLLCPAWINKFYIFDLRKESSFIHWLVEQGHTVFVISWVNPDERHREKSFDDYLKEGPLAALDVIEKTTGSKSTSIIGYCLGGTLLSILLAHLKATGQEKRVASATYLTTLTDFSHAGDLSIFVDEAQLENMERRMSSTGYLDGKSMALTFNMLRANDLIWHFVVNNYLLGKDPFPFDLLYWNSDATRMPAKMHSFYLRSMYQSNLLVKAGGITVAGTPIDLRTIQTPTYMLSTKEDHIAPWMSTYKATQLFSGSTTFVLADSGHVAGVINPPTKQKYCFWENRQLPHSPKEWFEKASHTAGSWWPHWNQWQKAFAGEKIPARTIKKSLEHAPGRYVKERIV